MADFLIWLLFTPAGLVTFALGMALLCAVTAFALMVLTPDGGDDA